MTSLLTNTAVLSALRLLSATQASLAKTQDQISSGLRVSNACDDAAYWSIGVAMRSQVSTLSAVNDGLALTKSIASVTTTAVNQIIGIMQGLQKDLVTSQTPGVDLGQIQQDISAKQKLIIGIANSASFNGQNWLVQQKAADVTITEDHHAQVTRAAMLAGAAGNRTDRGPMPTFVPAPDDNTIYSASPNPGGYLFDDSVDYTATATETDSTGTQKQEAATISGIEHDQAYTVEGWTYTKDNTSDPHPGSSWKPIEFVEIQRNRAIPVANLVDDGSVDFSDVETLNVPASSSSASGVLFTPVDTSQFNLFTNYTGTTKVVEKAAYVGESLDLGSIAFGNRTFPSPDPNDPHTLKAPYSSYEVDNGFEENVGALDANLYGVDGSTYRKQIPEDDLALGSKTTVLNFNVDGSDKTHQASGQGMLDAVNLDLSALTAMSSKLGSLVNRLDTMTTFNGALADAITAGVGSLTDADMSVASTRLQALQTQQQLGIHSLSIANENSQLVLKLFSAA